MGREVAPAVVQVSKQNYTANCRHIMVEGQLGRFSDIVTVDVVLTGPAAGVLWATTSESLSAPAHPYIVCTTVSTRPSTVSEHGPWPLSQPCHKRQGAIK